MASRLHETATGPSDVSWNLQLAVREGQLETFRELMREMIEATAQEKGVRAYRWHLSEDGTACHIHERYADSEATMVHLGTFGSRFAERFLACAEPTAFFVHGAPGPEVRAVLDGFGAQYLSWFGGLVPPDPG